MPEPNDDKKETGEQKTEIPQREEDKTKIEELTKKQGDLNQGIAKYRDDAQKSQEREKELGTKLAETETRLAESEKSKEKKIDEEDAAMLENWGKEKGFVTKEDLEKLKTEQTTGAQQELHNQAVTGFLKAHPQYNTDENWEEVKKEFSKFYKQPITLQGYQEVLEKVHQTLSIPDIVKQAGDKVRAEFTTKSRLSLGGGPQMTPEREATVDDLQKRYPNLSKEQIAMRLDEIDVLYKKEEKE